MAYNYYGSPYIPQYYPAAYAPMVQQMPQPQPQQPQPQQSQTPSPTGIIWVSGEREAQMYPVAPNNAVALWETSGKIIYLKQADATGKPTIKVYDLVERADTSSETTMPDYATKEDLGKVVGVVKGFDDILGSLRADIEGIKGDMYGIAGKKKPTKKADGEDDA